MKKMNLQFFADARTGVNPTNEILFGVCTTGRPVDLKSADYTTVKDRWKAGIPWMQGAGQEI